MLPGLANKTTLFTVCDERWGGEYVMAHKLTFILQLQTENWICIAIIKLALNLLLAFVNRVFQRQDNQAETLTVSRSSSTCLGPLKMRCGYLVFLFSRQRKEELYHSSDLGMLVYLKFSKTKRIPL